MIEGVKTAGLELDRRGRNAWGIQSRITRVLSVPAISTDSVQWRNGQCRLYVSLSVSENATGGEGNSVTLVRFAKSDWPASW